MKFRPVWTAFLVLLITVCSGAVDALARGPKAEHTPAVIISPVLAGPESNTRIAELAQKLFFSGQALKAALPAARKGTQEDLELFWVAEVLAAAGRKDLANQYFLYLKNYYETSPLLALLPAIPADTPYLEEFNPDPELSRLIKTAYALINVKYMQASDPQFLAFTVLLSLQLENALNPKRDEDAAFSDYLKQYPDADFSGWAAYQLAWADWQKNQGSTMGLADFWSKHKSHPLAAEAMEAMDVPYFSPRRLALQSSLLPGWGDETLEPSLHESSGLWYSEILFIGGLVGFALAGQNNNRLDDMTGALIFANLLFLNHQGSAEKTYFSAIRRNYAEKKKFSLDRQDVPMVGNGHFDLPEYSQPQPEPLADELVISIIYQTRNAGSGFANHGWVDDSQLSNIGFKGSYMASVVDVLRTNSVSLGLAIAPHGRIFLNYANLLPDQDFQEGLSVREFSLGADAAMLIRIDFGGPWLQLQISGGPAWQSRSLNFDGTAYSKQNLLGSETVALDWGGMSGTYLHAGVFLEDSLHNDSLTIQNQIISIPSQSLGWEFGLGIRF